MEVRFVLTFCFFNLFLYLPPINVSIYTHLPAMKKSLIFLPVSLLLLLSCHSKPKGKPNAGSTTIFNDTVMTVYSYKDYVVPPVSKDTTLLFGKLKYNLHMTAGLDTSQTFEAYRYYVESGENHKDIDKGYNGYCQIELKNDRGGTVFNKKLTKDDFLKVSSRGVLATSNFYLPTYRGYLKAFDAFLFEIQFTIPDSDVSELNFFMIKNKGRDLAVYSLDSLVQDGCDGQLEVALDGKSLLANTYILKSDGRTIDISTKNYAQVATRLLNSHDLLVVRAFDDKLRKPNAFIMDVEGNVQDSFIYRGYYKDFAYTLPAHRDTITNTLFMLDESSRSVRVIPCNDPTSTWAIPYKDMPPIDGPKLPNEIEFKLSSDGTHYFFYLDPVIMKLRYNLE